MPDPTFGVATAVLASTAVSAAGARSSAKATAKADRKQREQSLNSIEGLRLIREGLTDDVLNDDFLGRFSGGDIFGVRPDQIDLESSILQAVQANQNVLSPAQNLVDETNRLTTEASFDRARRFDPNFTENLSTLSDTARQLLRGEIPTDVVDTILRDRAGFAAAGGIPGTQGPLVARDLGRTSLDLIGQGGSLFQQINAIRDSADPLSRHISNGSFFLSPSQQIEADVANNQIRSSSDPIGSRLFDIEFRGAREEQFANAKVPVPVDNTLGATLSSVGGSLTGLLSSGVLGSAENFLGLGAKGANTQGAAA